jgi:hypothetical protein
MRCRVAGALVALALVAQVGVLAPSAGAAGREVCASLAGRAVFNPPLPPIGTNTRVVTTISSQQGLNFQNCSSPAGGFGVFTFKAKAKTAQNCRTLGEGSGLTAVGTGTIKWKKGKPSTLSALTFVVPQRSQSFTAKLTANVTKGQFAGKKLSATVFFAPANGSCQPPNGLAEATISLPRGTKMVIS